MEFEWDPAKAAAKLEKHGIDFRDAALAPWGPQALTIHANPVSRPLQLPIQFGLDPG